MSGTTDPTNVGTGIAPGFGGFATTAAGQQQYQNRLHNPYAFLQQGQQVGGVDQTGTAPAATQSFASGGLTGVSPQQQLQMVRYLHLRGKGGYRRGGLVPGFADGGDAGGGDSSGGGSGDAGSGSGSAGSSADAGGTQSGGQSDNGGFGGFDGAGAGGTAVGGFGGFDGGAMGPTSNASDIGAASAMDAGGFGSGMSGQGGFMDAGVGGTTPGSSQSSTGQLGGSPMDQAMGIQGFGAQEDPSIGQAAMAGIGKGISSVAGPVGSIANAVSSALGYGSVTNAVSNALGLGTMSPGASFGASALGAIGSALGGPLGGIAGAALGGFAGAHGETGSGVGGHANGASTDALQTDNYGTADASDTANLIRKVNGSLDSTGYAAGGQVQGSGPNHNFHKGSGLVHGMSDGRADALHMHVPPGGYVVPADVVSGLGQGNTMAGAKRLKQTLPPNASFAGGGTVPVRLSAGEFYIHPGHVAALGHGDHKAGSDKLDEMVGHVRRISAQQVAKMPPPR